MPAKQEFLEAYQPPRARSSLLCIRVRAQTALFSDPRMQGEPYTFLAPTYAAVKGVCRAIYRKKEVEPEPERVTLLSAIRRMNEQWRSVTTADGKGQTLRTSTLLVDVDYLFHFRFVENPYVRNSRGRPPGVNAKIATDHVLDGCEHRRPFLGSSEHSADWEPIEPGAELPAPIDITRNLGSMYFESVPEDIYAPLPKDKGPEWGPAYLRRKVNTYWARLQLKNGVVDFPEDLRREVNDVWMRFRAHNISEKPSSSGGK